MSEQMTPQERAAAIIGGHYDCEDPWYSCPLSEEGCANEHIDKTVCTCGHDDRKQNVERLIAETRRAALLEAAGILQKVYEESFDDWNGYVEGVIETLTRLAQEG